MAANAPLSTLHMYECFGVVEISANEVRLNVLRGCGIHFATNGRSDALPASIHRSTLLKLCKKIDISMVGKMAAVFKIVFLFLFFTDFKRSKSLLFAEPTPTSKIVDPHGSASS